MSPAALGLTALALLLVIAVAGVCTAVCWLVRLGRDIPDDWRL